jgi:Flp pilus assembly protein TadG
MQRSSRKVLASQLSSGSGRPDRLPSRQRRGAAIIELVVASALLLSLAFGAVEFSYYLCLKHTLTAAAREGARAAIVPGNTNSQVNAAVASEISAVGLGNCGYSVVTVPADITTATTATSISVTVSCNWGTAGSGFAPLALIGTSKKVSASVAMRAEN